MHDNVFEHSSPLVDSPVRTSPYPGRASGTGRRRLAALIAAILAIIIAAPPGLTSTLSAQSRRKPASKQSTRKQRPKPSVRRAPRPAEAPRVRSIVADSSTAVELAGGIVQSRLVTRGGHVVNVTTIDLKRGARLRTYKASDSYDALESVRGIFRRADSLLQDTVYVATNASFWRAGQTSPIGPTITDGEVIEMPGYKSWSSLLLFEDGTAAIDRVRLQGEIVWKHRRFPIEGVNRRGDESGVVLYNSYYGASVPRGSRKSDSAILAELFANRVGAEIGDNTEGETIDTAEALRSYREMRLREDREHPLLKIACVFPAPRRKRAPTAKPVVGELMQLIVQRIDTGRVEVPRNGMLLSLGSAAEWMVTAQPGDTIGVQFELSPRPAAAVRDLVSGTPRLVRDGVAAPEQNTEGSRAQRFVEGSLSRTAVGISRSGDTLLLATVDSPDPASKTTGMTLLELAQFMESIGAYQAMNFDGGGSATMVVAGETISRQGGRPFNRRVSNALLVVKQRQSKPAGSGTRGAAPR